MLVLKTGEEVELDVVWVQDPCVDSSMDSRVLWQWLAQYLGQGLVWPTILTGAQVWSFSVPISQSCGLDLPPDSHDYSSFPGRGFVAWPVGWESGRLVHLVSRFKTGLVLSSVINFKLGTALPWCGNTCGMNKAWVLTSEGTKDGRSSNILLFPIWLSFLHQLCLDLGI